MASLIDGYLDEALFCCSLLKWPSNFRNGSPHGDSFSKNGAKIIFQVQKMRETLSKSNEIESISRERRSDLKKVFSSQEKMVSLMDQQVNVFISFLNNGFSNCLWFSPAMLANQIWSRTILDLETAWELRCASSLGSQIAAA